MCMITIYIPKIVIKVNILLVFLLTLSAKQKYIITAHIPKYMYD